MVVSLWLGLLAAVLYAASALLIKRAADLGVGLWRSAFLANLTTALLFQPLWALGGTLHPEWWWQPVLTAACFVCGQWLTFLSLEKGDVSVATPVLGIKILLVALLVSWFGGGGVGWRIWVAALLATAGVALINRSGRGQAHHHVGRTIMTAGLAATAYALFDVLVQRWTPAWGVGRFLPITLAIGGTMSLAYVTRFRAPLREIPRSTWPWLAGAVGLMGLQSLTITGTIAHWGNAAAVNVVYGSRGLWSVVLVWLVGHWVKNRERQLGGAVLRGRLIGAVLMLAAIALVLI